MTGIYFLYLDNVLQYIGQSVDVDQRVRNHRHIGKIIFDRHEVFECPTEWLDDVEKECISTLKPMYNVHHHPSPSFRDDILESSFSKTYIAVEYYKIKHPERKYSRHYAVRQWRQDNGIDRDILKVVINKVFEEQTKILKKA